jgi:putative exosortase-associated protein (TIGR04073 family)
MRKSISLLGAVALVALLATGCAGPEKKFGRGMNNVGEIVRWGEMRRSIEQAGVWQGPQAATGRGLISGFNRSVARIGIGVYEVVTFPIGSYDPIATHYLTPAPAYPDSYKPGLPNDPIFGTDTALGFSGGDIMPIVPGSRFSVFNTP